MPDPMPQPKRKHVRTSPHVLEATHIMMRLLWWVGCAALFAILYLIFR